MGNKLRDHKKDLTLSSGTKPEKKRPVEYQSNILGSSHRGQSEKLGRKVFGRIRSAQRKEQEKIDRKEEIRLLPAKIKGLAQRLQNKDFHTWTSQEFAQAQKLLGEKVIRGIISNQEKKRKVS